MDIKGKINRNESYGEKNRGPIYMPRFITVLLYFNFSYIVILFVHCI